MEQTADVQAQKAGPAAQAAATPEIFRVNPNRNKKVVSNTGEMFMFHQDCHLLGHHCASLADFCELCAET
jgi:hypothetical protein